MNKRDSIDHLNNVLHNYPTFKFGKYLSNGYEIWKTNVGGFLGLILLMVVITMFLGLIPFIGTIANWLIVTPALTAGFYLVSHKIANKESHRFEDGFSGFSYAADIIVSKLITGIPFVIAFVILGFLFFTMGLNLEGTLENFKFQWWIFFPILGIVYLANLFSFVLQFILMYNLDAINAVKFSCRFVMANWFSVFFFNIVVALIASLGFILLIIGIFITIPLCYCMLYAAFREYTDLEEFLSEDNNNETLSRLVEDW